MSFVKSLYLSIYPSIFLIYQPMYLSLIFICLQRLFFCLCIHLSIIYMSICPSIICLSTHPSIYLWNKLSNIVGALWRSEVGLWVMGGVSCKVKSHKFRERRRRTLVLPLCVGELQSVSLCVSHIISISLPKLILILSLFQISVHGHNLIFKWVIFQGFVTTIVEPFQLPVCVCGETRPSSTPASPVPQSSTASKPVGLNCHPLSSRLSITEEENNWWNNFTWRRRRKEWLSSHFFGNKNSGGWGLEGWDGRGLRKDWRWLDQCSVAVKKQKTASRQFLLMPVVLVGGV